MKKTIWTYFHDLLKIKTKSWFDWVLKLDLASNVCFYVKATTTKNTKYLLWINNKIQDFILTLISRRSKKIFIYLFLKYEISK